MIKVQIYETEMGVCPFNDFLDSVKDTKAEAIILRALDKIEKGLPGGAKSLGGELWEHRIPYGCAYRIYYHHDNQKLIIVLGGSKKGDQEKEIKNARRYLEDYKRRQTKERNHELRE